MYLLSIASCQNLQVEVRCIEHGPARRLVAAARFHPHEAILHDVDAPHAVSTTNLVEILEHRQRRRESEVVRETRSYVAIDCLYHPNLGAMQYGAFFNLCRLHGVSFDLQQRTGTAFMLSDSLAAGIVGLIGVGSGEDGSKTAMKTIHKALRFIESQVGSMRLQGEFDSEKSNFPEISATIKALVQSFEPGKAEGKKSGH